MFQLTVEEYVEIMEMLVNDFRFTMYNMCYKRVLMCWITLAFCVLLGLLFSGITGILLFSLGVGWLFLNAVAIFVCMWAKMGLARGLEKCLARVNKQLMKHKILIALDDRGNISCHKIHLCFIYFDSLQCVKWVDSKCQFKQRHQQRFHFQFHQQLLGTKWAQWANDWRRLGISSWYWRKGYCHSGKQQHKSLKETGKSSQTILRTFFKPNVQKLL